MYAATATISVAIEKLKQFPVSIEEPLLIETQSELEIARNLLESRWQIWNSIFITYKSVITQYLQVFCHHIYILQQALATLSNTTFNPYLSRFLSLWQFASERKSYSFLI